MTATNVPAPCGAAGRQELAADTIDPTRAAAAYQRWRRALADALGEDPGARLDRPDRRLTMLRVFGSTRRLAELCLKYPEAAADALCEGPSRVLAETAREIAALTGGVGGAHAIHAALAPLKHRADIAVALAELSGVWSAAEATAARADFCERLVETTLAWLLRGAAHRGELPLSIEEGPAPGIFALAGGDFAHEDLAPLGPLDVAVIYDDAAFAGPALRMAERAFVRMAGEFKDAIEGGPGEISLFTLRTPFGAGVSGAGFVEALSRARVRLADPQQSALRAWLATARVVAGDRRAGGAFLETIEETVWNAPTAARTARSGAVTGAPDDPRAAFRAIADVFRFAFGAQRPVFRTASARVVFETAAASGLLPKPLAARLIAGEDFVQSAVSRGQMMRGALAVSALRADEAAALARLAGFADPADFVAALAGATADARNAFSALAAGPLAEFDRYKAEGEAGDDVDKLEDLGFRDGVWMAGLADAWAGLAGATTGARFSAVAPGLLTAFGETQRPDLAVRLFDRIVAVRGSARDDFAAIADDGPVRDGLVVALGCFAEAVAPLTENAAGAAEFFEERGRETPESGAEWLSRFGAPPRDGDVAAIGGWRRENIARAAVCAASGAASFRAVADVLAAVDRAAFAATFDRVIAERGSSAELSMHLLETSACGLPGAQTALGFIAHGGDPDAAEDAARACVDAFAQLGDGLFAVALDVSRRPGGPLGRLAPDAAAFRSYVQSEATAADQILLARARVIAGTDAAQEAARKALRCTIAGARRSDTLLREVDRGRAQRLRRDRAGTEWDAFGGEGALADIDLIIGVLVHKHGGALPGVQSGDADAALDALARAGALQPAVAEALKDARQFWLRLACARALARWSDPQREPVRARFAGLLARAAAVDRFALIRPLMRGYSEEVSRFYAQLVLGRPASTLAASA